MWVGIIQSCEGLIRKTATFPEGFTGASDSKEPACNAGDLSLIPGLGRSSEEGDGNSLHYSCLGNSMDRRAWRATVHRVAKNQTRLTLSHFSVSPDDAGRDWAGGEGDDRR